MSQGKLGFPISLSELLGVPIRAAISSLMEVTMLSNFDLQAIEQLPHVETVTETEHTIIINLRAFKASDFYDSQTVYQIPNSRIILRKCGIGPKVKIFKKNLDKGIRVSYDTMRGHPNVFDSGTPCLGNIKTAFYRYLRTNEYAVAATLLVQFLQQTY
jgi:hypothetical protein